jgi:hypothetical protein
MMGRRIIRCLMPNVCSVSICYHSSELGVMQPVTLPGHALATAVDLLSKPPASQITHLVLDLV